MKIQRIDGAGFLTQHVAASDHVGADLWAAAKAFDERDLELPPVRLTREQAIQTMAEVDKRTDELGLAYVSGQTADATDAMIRRAERLLIPPTPPAT